MGGSSCNGWFDQCIDRDDGDYVPNRLQNPPGGKCDPCDDGSCSATSKCAKTDNTHKDQDACMDPDCTGPRCLDYRTGKPKGGSSGNSPGGAGCDVYKDYCKASDDDKSEADKLAKRNGCKLPSCGL